MRTQLVFSVEVAASQVIVCEISGFPNEAQKGDYFRARFLGPKVVAMIDRREWIPCGGGWFKFAEEETLCIYCIVDREVFNNLVSSAKVASLATVIVYEIPAQNWRDPL